MSHREPLHEAPHTPAAEERVLRTLRLLPRSEIDDILSKNDVVEAKCEFCATCYRLTPDYIRENL